MSFGQDRYRRRYWILPKCGGIFVEGLESAEPESIDLSAPEDIEVNELTDNTETKVANTEDDAGILEKMADVESNIEFTCSSRDDTSNVPTDTLRDDNSVLECSDNFGKLDAAKNATATTNKFDDTNVVSVITEDNAQVTNLENHGSKDESNNCTIPDTVNQLLNNLKHEPEQSNDISDQVRVKVEVRPAANGIAELASIVKSETKTETFMNCNVDIKSESQDLKLEMGPSKELVGDYSALSKLNDVIIASQSSAEAMKADYKCRPTFRSIDSLLQPDVKADSFVLPSLSTNDLMQKNLNNAVQQGLWFCILPRMPCDDLSLTCPNSPGSDGGKMAAARSLQASTPLSFAQTSRTSTPNTSCGGFKLEMFGDDILSTPIGDWEMDYMATPCNVQTIPLGMSDMIVQILTILYLLFNTRTNM